jgi:RND family efflux transporter MFP subunit
MLAENKTYRIVGTLAPIHETHIGAQVPGQVKNVCVQIGDRVRKGDSIIELDPVFLEIELKRQTALFNLAAACYEEASAEWQRLKPLWEKETPSISKKNYEDALLRCKQRKAQLDQALADLENIQQRLSKTQIIAPYDGVIVKRCVDNGDNVTAAPAGTVAEIIDDSQLIFEFSLPQDLIGVISPASAHVQLEIPGLPELYVGPVSRVSVQLDKETRTFLCQALIDNSTNKIHPGVFVKGTVCWDE